MKMIDFLWLSWFYWMEHPSCWGVNIHLSDGHLTVILLMGFEVLQNHQKWGSHETSWKSSFPGTITYNIKQKLVKSWNVQMVFLFHHGGFHVDLFLRVYRSECDNRSLTMQFFSRGFCVSTSLHRALRCFDNLPTFFEGFLIQIWYFLSWTYPGTIHGKGVGNQKIFQEKKQHHQHVRICVRLLVTSPGTSRPFFWMMHGIKDAS